MTNIPSLLNTVPLPCPGRQRARGGSGLFLWPLEAVSVRCEGTRVAIAACGGGPERRLQVEAAQLVGQVLWWLEVVLQNKRTTAGECLCK